MSLGEGVGGGQFSGREREEAKNFGEGDGEWGAKYLGRRDFFLGREAETY